METYAPIDQVVNICIHNELLGKKPLAQANFICQNLKEYMVRGLLPVDSKLNFQVLKRKYAVSTGVIQTAITKLIDTRYAYKDSKGVFVAGLSMEEFREILNLRLILEKESIKVAIEQGDDHWESNIIVAFHQLTKLEKKFFIKSSDTIDFQLLKEWISLYRDFNLSLSLSPKFDLSSSFIKILYGQCEKYFLSSLLRHELSLKDISGHHEKLKNAVIARNFTDAELILTHHVQKIYQVLEKHIDTRNLN